MSPCLVKWYNWTAFDIVGELSFGESFGAVESGIGCFFAQYRAG